MFSKCRIVIYSTAAVTLNVWQFKDSYNSCPWTILRFVNKQSMYTVYQMQGKVETLGFYPLDSRNTKTKIPKTKMLISYKQWSYFSQVVSRKSKLTISSFTKNSNNNNIILGFSFMYLVSVYPTNRTLVSSRCMHLIFKICQIVEGTVWSVNFTNFAI